MIIETIETFPCCFPRAPNKSRPEFHAMPGAFLRAGGAQVILLANPIRTLIHKRNRWSRENAPGIFTYMYHTFKLSIGRYTIHIYIWHIYGDISTLLGTITYPLSFSTLELRMFLVPKGTYFWRESNDQCKRCGGNFGGIPINSALFGFVI